MSFQIGKVTIDTELALGPMAGVTNLPFRRLCKEHGVGLLYSEMVSAKGVMYHNKNTAELIETEPSERPIALQLFGEDARIMSEQAKVLEEQPFDFFDINMGCPVPKVVNNGEGSALMKDPRKVYDIVSAMVRAQSKPVLVKIRKGFEQPNAVEVAKAAEEAGASAIAVHGRLRGEYYSGKADWNCIREVKEAVSVPVIGSGDVTTPQEAVAMKTETGCDCVMIARAARGNPWIFSSCKAYMEQGILLPKPTVEEVIETVLRHAKMMIDWKSGQLSSGAAGRDEQLSPSEAAKGEQLAMREMRSHVAWYFAGYPASARLRQMSNGISTYAELEELLGSYGSRRLQ